MRTAGLNDFGKCLTKFLISRNISRATIMEALGLSASYMTKIMTKECSIPYVYIDLIGLQLSLNETEKLMLRIAANKTHGKLVVKTEGLSDLAMEILTKISIHGKKISEEAYKKIMFIILEDLRENKPEQFELLIAPEEESFLANVLKVEKQNAG